MGISEETLTVWAEIGAAVNRDIRAKHAGNPDEAEEVNSEVKMLFLVGNCGNGYNAAQAYSYATSALYKNALRNLEIVAPRACVCSPGAYTEALRELGANPTNEELQEVEDTYRPQVIHASYEDLQEQGWDKEAPEVDPLNKSGWDERTNAFLANPKINPIAKAMALQILDGSSVKEVARRHGVSIQTVTRTIAGEAVKLPAEFRYVINQVKLAKPAKTVKATVEFEETIDLSFFDEEPVAEIAAPVAEAVEVETAEIPAPVQVAEVITLADHRADRAEVVETSEASLPGKEVSALVVSLAEHRTHITKAAAQDATHRATTYHAFQQAESPPMVAAHLALTGPRAPSFGYADGYEYALRTGT